MSTKSLSIVTAWVYANNAVEPTVSSVKLDGDAPISDVVKAFASSYNTPMSRTSLWKPREQLNELPSSRAALMQQLRQHNGDYSKFCDYLSHAEVLDRTPSATPGRVAKYPVLLLVIHPGPLPPARSNSDAGESEDVVTELAMRFSRNWEKLWATPSDGAKANVYMKHQASKLAIFDGRYSDSDGPNTVGAPIQIFHPAFSAFVAEKDDTSLKPPEDLLKLAADFKRTASQIRPEAMRSEDTRSLLSQILARPMAQITNRNKTAADHIIQVPVLAPLGNAALVIVEEKSDLGQSGDASTQGSFSYYHHWSDNKNLLKRSFCPSFVVGVAGPWLVINGTIFTTSVISQHLTHNLSIVHACNLDDAHTMEIARVLYAFRKGVDRLATYYADLRSYSPTNDNSNRYFPLSDAYEDEDHKPIQFRYIRPLKCLDPSNLAFLAVLKDDESRRVVVKFVERYGTAAHETLARAGYAPKLLYHGPIWLQEPERSGCGQRRMVVMEYIDGECAELKYDRTALPEAAVDVVRKAVGVLHDVHMVHGDIRHANIVIANAVKGRDEDENIEERVKVVDFDWAGKEGEVRYPFYLGDRVNWPDGVEGNALIEIKHDNEMLQKLSFAVDYD